MWRIVRYAGAFVVSVLIFLVVGELLARALDIVDRLNGYNRVLFTQGPDANLPYLLRPSVETEFLGTSVRVNRLGFRGPECAPRPAPGIRRVLMLGDSVVFGFAHAYQGPAGIPRTAAVGGTFALLYGLTGSLWAPVVAHAVMDITSGRIAYAVFAEDTPNHSLPKPSG